MPVQESLSCYHLEYFLTVLAAWKIPCQSSPALLNPFWIRSPLSGCDPHCADKQKHFQVSATQTSRDFILSLSPLPMNKNALLKVPDTILVTYFSVTGHIHISCEGLKPQHRLKAGSSHPPELTHSILFHLKTMGKIITKLDGNHLEGIIWKLWVIFPGSWKIPAV